MATTLFTTYRAPVNSFPTGQRDIGMHKAGRYSGFDLLQSGGALNLILSHTDKVSKTSSTNTTMPVFGSILFKSGIVAHVEDNINLVIETNSGNTMDRNDIIIAENIYQETQGGTPITFSIVKGPINSASIPTVPNPSTQIVLGVLKIAANGFQFSDITYTPSYPALPGDMTYEVLATIINSTVAVPPASTTVEGKTRYATPTEAKAKVLGNAALTPSSLADYQATTTFTGLVRRATSANINGGTSDLNNDELYITPALLQLFKGDLQTYIQQIINNSLPGQATTTVPGIMRIANPQELAARSSMSVALAPGHLPSLSATSASPGLVRSTLEDLTTQGVPTLLPDVGTVTPAGLRHLGLGAVKVVEGSVITTSPDGTKGPNDWPFNRFTVNPPVGYTIEDLVSFSPSPYFMSFKADTVNGSVLFINWRRSGTGAFGFIEGTANCSNNNAQAAQMIKYIALFIKTSS